MFAVAFLFFFLLYLLISAGLAWAVVKLAGKRGVKGWAWGLTVFVLMLGLIFWDWLPMELSHRHKCSNYAGFTQYKPLDEWTQENPGVAETLRPITGVRSTFEGNRERYLLNQRFAWDIIRTGHWFHIYEKEERITDTKTGEILAKYVNFGTNLPPLGLGANRLSDYKFWMQKSSCEKDNRRLLERKFRLYKYLIQYQREHKQ